MNLDAGRHRKRRLIDDYYPMWDGSQGSTIAAPWGPPLDLVNVYMGPRWPTTMRHSFTNAPQLFHAVYA
jgi:hypothetical protein